MIPKTYKILFNVAADGEVQTVWDSGSMITESEHLEFMGKLNATHMIRINELAAQIAYSIEMRDGYRKAGNELCAEKDARIKALEARLTDDQCRQVLSDLEEREWSGLENDDIRMIAGLINDARAQSEREVSK